MRDAPRQPPTVATPGRSLHARHLAVHRRTVMFGGTPMLFHSTVTFCDGNVGSLALWRLNMATAREPS